MGIETAAAGLVAGSAIYGASQSRKAGKRATRAANEQTNILRGQQETADREAAELNRKIQAQQKKIAVGEARSNRARVRGGIFGEPDQTPRAVSSTLG